MTEPPPEPYRVSYSGRVRQELVALAATAREHGLASKYVVALKEIDRLLHLYPQFGDPLDDLTMAPGQVRIGIVPPLVMRYILDEEHRLVMVATLPLLLLPKGKD